MSVPTKDGQESVRWRVLDSDAGRGLREMLVEMIAELLGSCAKKHVIKERIREALGGPLVANRYEKLMGEACALMVARERRDKREFAQNAIEFYEGVLADGLAPLRDKLAAQEKLTELVGVGAKFKEGTDPDESARAVRDALAAMNEVTDAEDSEGPELS